jgi:Phage tail protein
MPQFVWQNLTQSTRRAFSGRSGYTLTRYSGLSIPPKDHLSARGPRQHGGTYIATYFRPREFSLEVAVAGCDMEELQAKHRLLARSMNPLDDSQLLVIAQDESRYYLSCHLATQLEWVVADGRVATILAQCIADDPLWYRTFLKTAVITTAAVGPLVIPFVIPSRIGGNLDDLTVTNEGQVFCYPILTFAGVADDVRMYNVTTGEVLEIDEPIAAGETLTVDMGARTAIISMVGVPDRNVVASAVGDWWALQLGANDLTFVSNNAAAMSGTVSWRERFLAVI